MNEPKLINAGELCGGAYEHRINQSKRVWSTDGVAPALCAAMGAGGGTEVKIIEYTTTNSEMGMSSESAVKGHLRGGHNPCSDSKTDVRR